jgi:release factor glutamine methyltransferase
MGLDLVLDGDVLAPRSETELLGRTALSILSKADEPSPLVIDMCSGSGNLACALATALPKARVLAADLTDGAVRTARLNVERLGLRDRVTVRQGDLFSALEGDEASGRATLVVCNPPYISTGKLAGESAHLLEAEPREAFDGGPYGISILQRLVRAAPAYLAPGGHLAFEFGVGQERQAASLVARAGPFAPLDLINDEQGVPRVAVVRYHGAKP